MSAPLVTVLLAVHNGARHLPATLASLWAQTYGEFKLLVCDDASTDETPALLAAVRDPRMRVHRQVQNLGLTATLQAALERISTPFVVRQDADDLSHPDRLGKQLAFLHANPGVAALGSQGRVISEAGAFLENRDLPLTHSAICFAQLFDNPLLHSAVTFRRSAIMEVGGYDPRFRVSQDYELWSRLGQRHALANLPERLLTLRQRAASVTRTQAQPELVREIHAAQFARLFPGQTLSPDELDLLAGFRTHLRPDQIAPFEALLQRLVLLYRAPGTGDFRRLLALLHERLGYNLLTQDRPAAARQFAHALAVSPARAWRLPWARMAALLLLGERARQLYRRLRPSSA